MIATKDATLATRFAEVAETTVKASSRQKLYCAGGQSRRLGRGVAIEEEISEMSLMCSGGRGGRQPAGAYAIR